MTSVNNVSFGSAPAAVQTRKNDGYSFDKYKENLTNNEVNTEKVLTGATVITGIGLAALLLYKGIKKGKGVKPDEIQQVLTLPAPKSGTFTAGGKVFYCPEKTHTYTRESHDAMIAATKRLEAAKANAKPSTPVEIATEVLEQAAKGPRVPLTEADKAQAVLDAAFAKAPKNPIGNVAVAHATEVLERTKATAQPTGLEATMQHLEQVAKGPKVPFTDADKAQAVLDAAAAKAPKEIKTAGGLILG